MTEENSVKKKIALVLDTNKAHNPKADWKFNSFSIPEYDNGIAFIERHDLIEKVDIFIPQIVLEEISEHKLRKIRSKYTELRKCHGLFEDCNLINLTTIGRIDLKAHISALKEKKLKEDIQIIPIPENREELFNKILQMALKKYPPFKLGDSDQGFKDALLLLSIQEYFKISLEYREVYLFSDDKGFDLLDVGRMSKVHGVNLKIIKDSHIQDFLSDKFKVSIEFRKFLEEGSVIEGLQNDLKKKLPNNQLLKKELKNSGVEFVDLIFSKAILNEISDSEYEIVFPFVLLLRRFDDGEILKIEDDYMVVFVKNGGTWLPKIT